MSRGKQMLRELGHAVREGAKEGAEESARAAYFSVYDRGFNEAAQTCLGVLSDATEELLARMKSGNLSKQEQALYARLTELTAEMDERLRNACQEEPTGDALSQPAGARPGQPTRLA
ncbi:hypothetical protein OOK39_31680 [Streptomyces sp. NBC_00264]|uniref:hypothetical protein n=1 Tax=unclassified Streptomyces TaxID=2593676 RepID=UPI0022566D5B|nr:MULTISPECIES: hypothetical protein [unclassified Streptomyces]MCX5163792.1 hypothetical protein [Streptomyces sp. NBC_00305]MCX5222315.1 hypothetical protein [Streptomyces sp. NBC_00264]